MDSRQQIVQKWLAEQCQLTDFLIQNMTGDASFRRYYRIQHANGSYVLMDAHLELESCPPFIAISQALRKLGLQSPEILASDVSQGLLLLTDFGDDTLLNVLTVKNAKLIYSRVLDELATLSQCRDVSGWTVPVFTETFMRQELALSKEWFLQTHLKIALSAHTEKLLNQCFDFIAKRAAHQPMVFMHRDFHAGNLMLLPDQTIGILDFQNAFIGPVTYDLVSLLRDAYIAWPAEWVTELALSYRDRLQLSMSDEEFLYGFDVMGLQRQLKALLTFARKYHRDHNDHYLKHIPRTVNYILTVAERYPECNVLCALLKETLLCEQ